MGMYQRKTHPHPTKFISLLCVAFAFERLPSHAVNQPLMVGLLHAIAFMVLLLIG